MIDTKNERFVKYKQKVRIQKAKFLKNYLGQNQEVLCNHFDVGALIKTNQILTKSPMRLGINFSNLIKPLR